MRAFNVISPKLEWGFGFHPSVKRRPDPLGTRGRYDAWTQVVPPRMGMGRRAPDVGAYGVWGPSADDVSAG